MQKNFLLFFLIPIFTLMIPKLHAASDKTYQALDLFTKALYIVEKDYVETVKDYDLVYGAIEGMLNSLDPYSTFLPPDVYKELKVDTRGRFGGVGIEVTKKKGVLTIVTPIEDTPAARAGLQPGDRITKIDGVSTKNMSLAKAVQKMRGPRNKKIRLTLWRRSLKKSIEVTLKREIIKIKSVKAKILDSGLAYLRITNFQERTSEELKKKLKEFIQKTPKLKGAILDLRNNPGGLLEEAVRVSDLFLKSGIIVSTRGRVEMSEAKKAKLDPFEVEVPLVVLINEGSASASEIVAGALGDLNRAKLFGTNSFGKGSVQTVVELGQGAGLKLTVAKYYTPSGKSISGKGIKPHYTVEFPKENGFPFSSKVKNDPQLKAAEEFLLSGKIPLAIKKKKQKDSEELPEVE